MAWSYDPSAWVDGSPVVHATDFQHIAADIHTWGGDVNAGAHNLTNVAGLSYPGVMTISGATLGTSGIRLTPTTGSGALSVGGSGSADDKLFLECFNNAASGSAAEVWLTGYAVAAMPKLFVVATTVTYGSTTGFGIGTSSPTVSGTGILHVTGNTTRLLDTSRTPANSAASGNDGEVCMDNSYVYIHTGGSWRRAAVSTF
jgi:hypothetical protein